MTEMLIAMAAEQQQQQISEFVAHVLPLVWFEIRFHVRCACAKSIEPFMLFLCVSTTLCSSVCRTVCINIVEVVYFVRQR